MVGMEHIAVHQAKSETHKWPFYKRVPSHIQIAAKIVAQMAGILFQT